MALYPETVTFTTVCTIYYADVTSYAVRGGPNNGNTPKQPLKWLFTIYLPSEQHQSFVSSHHAVFALWFAPHLVL